MTRINRAIEYHESAATGSAYFATHGPGSFGCSLYFFNIAVTDIGVHISFMFKAIIQYAAYLVQVPLQQGLFHHPGLVF